MLKLVNIKKDYKVADTTVKALKGISVTFRNNEFVSILGPSGCGKTTLLNIIGGLDKYTSGKLYVDEIATNKFNDSDWDTYRNHRIGFVFQSYNLIPHQTILENVELALTIGGIGKDERVARAKEALDKVGLSGQYNKKPNQLSGGQCQRVAIARALVNEPEILLADEPTGALDTKTSVQIMELIQEISKDRLVIMVTHNPELAEKYSTRIIRLLDGNLVEDTAPYNEKEENINETNNEKIEDTNTKDSKEEKDIKIPYNKEDSSLKEIKKSKQKKEKKSKLSFWTAFKLSARNLKSKFKRTLMVCVAGSIGIIGVATVLAVSTGVSGFVNDMQDDMLSGNPITISEQTINLDLMMSGMSTMTQANIAKSSLKDNHIDVDYMIGNLVERSGGGSFSIQNDITNEYINYIKSMPEEYYSAIATYYGINLSNNIYTNITLDNYGSQNMSLSSIETMYTSMLKSLKDFSSLASFVPTMTTEFQQYPNNTDFINSQYDIVSNAETSYIATKENEIMIVVSDDDKLTDLFLGQFGYYSQNEFFNSVYKAIDDKDYNPELDKATFTYDEIVGKTFTYYPNNTVYNKTPENNPLHQVSPFTYNAYVNNSFENGMELKITAVLRTKKDINYGCMETGIYYTPALTEKFITDGLNSEIVNYLYTNDQMSFNSGKFSETLSGGITYSYNYYFKGNDYQNNVGFVGSTSALSSIMGSITGATTTDIYTISLRELGGINMPNEIAIYPTNFTLKDNVTDHLDAWNEEGDIIVNDTILSKDQRSEITYTDSLELIITMINSLIDVVTYALVAFTALSLVVSTVMISIITYVSVIERVKEIGVIRSLGGRKKDVSRLFNAEAFIIGGISGLIGVGITYLISFILNLIVSSLTGISSIAHLSPLTALIMITISILLTSISGLIPAKLASKKDPVVALRTE